jgi:hypothetical protein
MSQNSAENAAASDSGSVTFTRVLLTELEAIAVRREEPHWEFLKAPTAAGYEAASQRAEQQELERYQQSAAEDSLHSARASQVLRATEATAPPPCAEGDGGPAQAGESAQQQADEKRRREEQRRHFEAEAREREQAGRAKTEKALSLHEAGRAALSKERNGNLTEAERQALDEEENRLLNEARGHARDMDLTGLAFSGGGIRSATFCLGILQGLADLGLLRRVDYLSTVSGGGYIGSWLAAWIKREGGVENVEKQLRDTRAEQAEGRPDGSAAPAPPARAGVEEEPEPIFHLRSYSNYLAPRLGLGSADSWVLLAIYVRNFLLNQTLLLAALMAALVVPRAVMLFYDWDGSPYKVFWSAVLGAGMVLALLWACYNIIVGLRKLHRVRSAEDAPNRPGTIQTSVRLLHRRVLIPLLVAAVLVCWFAWLDLDPAHCPWLMQVEWPRWLLTPEYIYARSALAFGCGTALFFGLLHGVMSVTVFAAPAAGTRKASSRRGGFRRTLWWVIVGVATGLGGGALLGVGLQFASQQFAYPASETLADQAREVAIVTALGPPAALLLFVLGAILHIGLLGDQLDEADREWWASLCGWVMAYAAAWAVFNGLALFAVPFLIWAGPAAQALLGTGWAVTAISGVLAARSPRTGSGSGNRAAELLAQAAPPVFVVGLIVAASWLLSVLVDAPPSATAARPHVHAARVPADPPVNVAEVTDRSGTGKTTRTETLQFAERPDEEGIERWRYWAGLLNTRGDGLACDHLELLVKLAAWFVGFGLIATAAATHFGVNTFSLHGLYGNRLIRCYLGASRTKEKARADRLRGVPANTGHPPREPNPITGFDPLDDLPLHELRIAPALHPEVVRELPDGKRPYRGPFLLVNTALNLVQGDELAWQERKAEAFLLSPYYCGSKDTGYRDAARYADGVSLGNAVTVSGAAASPNMGYHSSAAVTALLTVFNARLGGWFGNPARHTWARGEPGLFLLFKELFGRTNLRSKYVYLSDGGHFENLGVYELVRRQCRYIIACDGGQDAGYQFYDLGSLIRKCRSDLGVPIELDVTPIKPQGSDGYSKWHCAIGLIRYDALDPRARPGLLLYIKSSLSGDEPSDVLNYAVEHPPFPHQTTLNQFFTESQFESYRALGHHVAGAVFAEAMRGLGGARDMTDYAHRQVVRRLFSSLLRRWFPPPPGLEEGFLKSVQAYAKLDVQLRREPRLAELSRSLYPELDGHPAAPAEGDGRPDPTDRERAELHAVSEMLQIMEDAWLGVHLEGYHAHPMNRGWMNVFRRWASSETFRRHWLTLRGEYGQDFVRFCEDELKLDHGQPRAYRRTPDKLTALPAWRQLQREFQAEWPGEKPLHELVPLALQHGPSEEGELGVWLIAVAAQTDTCPEQWTDDKYPCGIALVWEPPDAPDDYELFIWLRGPYRTLGIARESLDDLFPGILGSLRQRPNPRRHLRVRYPRAVRPGKIDRIQRAVWLAFFYPYGFQQRDALTTAPQQDLVLSREI